MTLNFSGSWYHNAGFYFEPDNRLKQESYDLINGDIRLNINQSLAIRAWARNLLNKEYAAGVSVSNQDIIVPAAPRTYGASVIVKF